jgi:heme exporter protein A
MLSVTDLACSRGERRLFSGLGFELSPGEWLQVGGANGSGKTTLLRTLVGLSPADSGSIRWQGQAVAQHRDEYHAALLYMGHASAIKDELSPIENLRLSLAVDGHVADDAALLAALARMGLRGREQLPSRVLSAGQRRRVLNARLLLRPAKLWVLDEPFNALDVQAVELLCSIVAEHLQGGGMAILTSHQRIDLPNGRVLSL